MRMTEELEEAIPDDNHIERQVSADERDCNSDRLFKAAQKDDAQHGNQSNRDPELMLQRLRHERVLDYVRRSVSRGERDRDDEVSSHESEQHQDKQFSLPARQQVLEHRDGAFTVRTLF